MERDAILLTPGPLTTTVPPSARCCATGDRGTPRSSRSPTHLPGPGRHRERRRLARVRAAAGQRHLRRGGGAREPRAARRQGARADNGAYCKRIGRLATCGPRAFLARPRRGPAVDGGDARGGVRDATRASPTSASALRDRDGNPQSAAGDRRRLRAPRQAAHRRRDELLRGARHRLRQVPVDAVVAASGKCIEGAPGMGFVIVRNEALVERARQLALARDGPPRPAVYMQKTGQWRFTPPTHVVAALAEALDQFEAEGGAAARGARYRRQLEALIEG